MLRIVPGFVIGILLLSSLTALPDLRYVFLALPLLAGAVLWPRLRFLMVIPIGFLWALLQAQQLNNHELPKALEGQNLVVNGTVTEVTNSRTQDAAFIFEVDAWEAPSGGMPEKIQLNWYRSAPVIYAGDRWQLTVRLKRPHGFMNQGSNDREKYLFHRGIQATGYVRDSKPHEIENNQLLGRAFFNVNRSRQKLAQHIQAALPDSEVLGPLLALTIGQRDQMTSAQWRTLQNTGTSHLMAISGLHIGLVSGLVFLLVRVLWGRSARLATRVPALKAAAAAALLSGIGYAAMSGFSLPAQRASIMVAMFSFAVLIDRKLPAAHVLALALLLILLLDPFAVLSAGLWMSFVAVAVLLSVVQRPASDDARWGKTVGKYTQWFKVQFVLLLGLLPLSIWYFQQSALVAPLVNLLAIPVVGFLVVPLLLCGSLLLPLLPSLAKIFLGMGEWLLEMCFRLLETVGELPSLVLVLPKPEFIVLLLAGMGLLIFLMPRFRGAGVLAAILLLPLLLNRPVAVAEGDFRVDVLDVGQGSAYVVQTAGHVMVFDAGPRFNEEYDAGAAIVVPFLRSRGIKRLDKMVISHADNDHIGGMQSILEAFDVTELSLPDPNAVAAFDSNACIADAHWQWDGVEFTVLNPPSGFMHAGKNRNNGSCVLLVAGANGRMLFTADIEKGSERILEKWAAAAKANSLQAQVMTVPHHGSRTSSTETFIAAVAPQIAIVSAGYKNSFGHPKPDIVARYQSRSAEVLETTQTGMLTLYFHHDGSIETTRYREQQRRYWHKN